MSMSSKQKLKLKNSIFLCIIAIKLVLLTERCQSQMEWGFVKNVFLMIRWATRAAAKSEASQSVWAIQHDWLTVAHTTHRITPLTTYSIPHPFNITFLINEFYKLYEFTFLNNYIFIFITKWKKKLENCYTWKWNLILITKWVFHKMLSTALVLLPYFFRCQIL